ncbi:helix-turn-helix transcriptional regulator [Ralstonia sp. UBA689]|uniref:helix-turn-helix transcriptional regulator n=1 Tax=Ralstonia sp. UBA689 TaxID=1947373 RepID=UPI0025D146EF|nr:helix-turn-helix transcriptional regulator [Ralstonia sp. UBA689]
MRTHTARPHPALRPYIDRYWSWEAEHGETIALPRLLPGTGAELFLHHGQPFRSEDGAALPPAHLLCVRLQPYALASAAGVAFTAIRIRAGRWSALARESIGRLLDTQAPLDALWGRDVRDWHEQVALAADFRQRVALIDAFLLARLVPARVDAQVAAAVASLYAAPHAASIDMLAAHLHLSRRQLERRFLAAEGLPPVAFRRLARFQHTARALHLQPQLPLLDTALAHGYYDQPQFNHEFRSLTGQSPQRYRQDAQAKTHFYKTSLA